MKFSLFSDIHYCPEVFWSGDLAHLESIQHRAEREGCDFIIHAGDFCHGPTTVLDYVEAYNRFHIKSYHCLGNHECDLSTYEETLEHYGLSRGYYFFDEGGYRFIILDTNYYRDGDAFVHYSMGNYFKHPDEREWVSPEQLPWLEETISASPFPCVLISHASFERGPDGAKNGEEIRAIIDEANKKRKHSVILVINGHYHRDHLTVLNNVLYFEINSASYDWVEEAHDKYPEEMCRQYRNFNHIVAYEDPVHAIVTLEGTRIKIDGMESRMMFGVTREQTGNPKFDPMGRPVTPRVLSADITLN